MISNTKWINLHCDFLSCAFFFVSPLCFIGLTSTDVLINKRETEACAGGGRGKCLCISAGLVGFLVYFFVSFMCT